MVKLYIDLFGPKTLSLLYTNITSNDYISLIQIAFKLIKNNGHYKQDL
jgi:general stress protein CsbA